MKKLLIILVVVIMMPLNIFAEKEEELPDNQNRRLVETGYDSYYRDENNQYYLRKDSDGNSEYIPVDCVFVDYGNESSILQIMNSDYGNEFKESVWRDYEFYLFLTTKNFQELPSLRDMMLKITVNPEHGITFTIQTERIVQ